MVMTEYQSVFSAASELSLADRLRLIDDLASTVPDDQPPSLPAEWLAEIERRSAELDSGAVQAQPWPEVRERLFGKHGIGDAD
jgi:putative addiction module component (TIGR02574 family)